MPIYNAQAQQERVLAHETWKCDNKFEWVLHHFGILFLHPLQTSESLGRMLVIPIELYDVLNGLPASLVDNLLLHHYQEGLPLYKYRESCLLVRLNFFLPFRFLVSTSL